MPVITFVYDTRVAGLITNPAKDAARWIERYKLEVIAEAIRQAPARSGTLKSSHINAGQLARGLHREGMVNNIAPHARFVHEGTANNGAGYIYPTRSPVLILRNNSVPPYVRAKRVRGQRANPWLKRAGDIVAVRHGARPGGVVRRVG